MIWLGKILGGVYWSKYSIFVRQFIAARPGRCAQYTKPWSPHFWQNSSMQRFWLMGLQERCCLARCLALWKFPDILKSPSSIMHHEISLKYWRPYQLRYNWNKTNLFTCIICFENSTNCIIFQMTSLKRKFPSLHIIPLLESNVSSFVTIHHETGFVVDGHI